jgi:hypothetical protein
VRVAAVAALGRIYAADPADALARRLVDSGADADLRWALAAALARAAGDRSTQGGKAALAALDQCAAKGPAESVIAARIARAFVGRPDDLPAFAAAYRAGR